MSSGLVAVVEERAIMIAFFHHRNEPELHVAGGSHHRRAEGRRADLGRDPRADPIRGADRLPEAISDAICDTFGVDRDYLRLSGGRDIDIDQRLRLWIAIRDRGLDHFAARPPRCRAKNFEK
ncbi:hypothetical protein GS489_33515, partial [Rhodococcus hoagii]|nr:hypothetical protein [Prescottella equi]